MKDNLVRDKSYAFASRIVKAYKYLTAEKREFIMAKQLLRCGTSIGANVEEAIAGVSRPDFVHKLTISAKECRETSYWLRLLHDNDYLPDPLFNSLHAQNAELLRILTSIILTAQKRSGKDE